MDTPVERLGGPPTTPAPLSDDELFDRYLDALASGRAEDPDVFLAGRPAVSSELRARLHGLHEEWGRKQSRLLQALAGEEAEGGLPFRRLGSFRLLRRLKRGGMGSVFLAEQEPLGRVVALKLVRPELQASESAAARFDREAQALAKLRHPNIVTVYGAGRDQGVRFLATEYIPGQGLDEILEESPAKGLPPREVVRWGAKLARALHDAHDKGIVHRDVKPSNIRISSEGEPLLLDFGIAHEQGAEGLTLTGPFVGTPLYAAPEQVSGGDTAVDARTDVYGLGATLYECLTGETAVRGGTMEQVLHRTISEDAVPLRKLDPSIPRDIELVVLTALRKAPDRRYATAEAMAEDLEALLEFRPIRARPPGPVERLWKWARRNPARATAAASLVLAALAVGAASLVRDHAERTADRRDAAAALAEAERKLGEFREKRLAARPLESEIERITASIESHYLPPETEAKLKQNEGAIARNRLERERAFYEILELIRRAERLDPDIDGADRIRGRLYVEKWDEAFAERDAELAAYYRDAAMAHDVEGNVLERVAGTVQVTLSTDPPGADVYLYRFRPHAALVPNGDRRFVPAAVADDGPPVTPGTPCLRVTRGAGALRVGDLVLGVGADDVTLDNAPVLRRRTEAGGVTARVLRNGLVASEALAPGLEVRATAAPLVLTEAARFGTTPIRDASLENGSYVALVRRDGYEDQRVTFFLHRIPIALDVRLHPEGTTPDGFVYAEGTFTSATPFGGGDPDERRSCWIMEREVTSAEYLAFLNDPATRKGIEAADRPVRFPRNPENARSGGFWKRTADGSYRLPDDWPGDWPVVGVSYDDAVAYAAWRTAKARAAGSRIVFALPTYVEWIVAAGGVGDRNFVFGDHFWPKWMNSCFSRPEPSPEPVLSYPVDESPSGAFDMSGNATEWCDGWWGSGRRARRLAGSSWAQARGDLFKVTGGSGARPDFANLETGFRLVARNVVEDR